MSAPARRVPSALRAFLASEAAGGLALMAAAALALLAANLPATADAYAHVLHLTAGPVLSPRLGPMTVHLWINDALMVLFFLLVGLDIKRELVDGRLARAEARRLPLIAAAVGMIVPALVYLAIVGGDAELRRGWAIPAATDIAFAIGVLALLGKRVPSALKLLLVTIAIVDDIGAVAIIALAYTDTIALAPLTGAALATLVLWLLNRRGVMALWPYLLVGAMLWLLVLQSGVHATIAGVVLAAAIPVVPTPGRPDSAASPLHRLEHALQPWVAFAVLPLFAFANAGVALAGFGWSVVADPLVAAIALGLLVGKQVGILGGIWSATRLGLARPPHGVSWPQLHALSLFAGVGFTMSLFIGGLAFAGEDKLLAEVKLGVLLGSLGSALIGTAILVRTTSPRP